MKVKLVVGRLSERLEEGMVAMLYVDDEFEVQGTLLFDRVWRAVPDFGTLHNLDLGNRP